MKKWLGCMATAAVVCSLMGMGGCTKWAEKSHPNWREATSGEHLVNLFWNDVKEKRTQDLGMHVAPEFMGVNEMGSLDKTALLEHLSHLDVESFQIGEVQTRSAGPDLLVSYVIALRAKSADGASREMRMRMMSVWQELKHGWVLTTMSAAQANAGVAQ